MRAGESFTGAPDPTTLVTSTSSSFVLTGGRYIFSGVGTFNSGTASLQRLGPDGQTWVTLNSPELSVAASLTSNDIHTLDCAPGQYRIAITGSTTAYIFWEVVRINRE